MNPPPLFPLRLWLLALVAATSLAAAPDPIETVEKAAGDWVRARAETSRLDSEWASQQQLLVSMVDGYNERAASLEARRDFLRSKTAQDRNEIASLQTANKSSAAALEATEAQLKTLAVRLLQLRASLPPRLAQALDLPYRSLAGGDLAVGDRMQLALTVLNRCVQFNRTITCEEELLKVEEGGSQQLLEVIYWGLSHGYALDRSAGKAWFGSPSAQGWRWEPLPGGSAGVARLIAINQGKAEPTFVEVPARVKSQPVDAAKEEAP